MNKKIFCNCTIRNIEYGSKYVRCAICGKKPNRLYAYRDFEPKKNNFGWNLRLIRRSKNITQKQMAKYIGVDFKYICDLENNRIEIPSTSMLLKISNALDISVELLNKKNSKMTIYGIYQTDKVKGDKVHEKMHTDILEAEKSALKIVEEENKWRINAKQESNYIEEVFSPFIKKGKKKWQNNTDTIEIKKYELI